MAPQFVGRPTPHQAKQVFARITCSDEITSPEYSELPDMRLSFLKECQIVTIYYHL